MNKRQIVQEFLSVQEELIDQAHSTALETVAQKHRIDPDDLDKWVEKFEQGELR